MKLGTIYQCDHPDCNDTIVLPDNVPEFISEGNGGWKRRTAPGTLVREYLVREYLVTCPVHSDIDDHIIQRLISGKPVYYTDGNRVLCRNGDDFAACNTAEVAESIAERLNSV